ncbi:MAG: hypothetical protein WBQ57_00030, partial [Rhodanobacteraceae bacterium]
MKRFLLACAAALAVVPCVNAGVISQAQLKQSQTWSAWGGEIGFRWNNDLLSGLDVRIRSSGTVPAPRTHSGGGFSPHTWFAVRETGGLDFAVSNSSLQRFTGGSLQVRGGYLLTLRDGSTIDLRNVTLRVRPDNPKVLDIVSGDGHAWFFSDRIMFELADNGQALAIRAADMRVSHALAARFGAPEAEGWELADLALDAQVFVQGANQQPDEVCSPYPWPNVEVPNDPGQIYQADLFMQNISIGPTGCEATLNGGQCDGPGGTDGLASLAPTSTLINNKNDGSPVATIPGDPLGTSTALHTGFVAWFTKFSGVFPPYNNDQHPFLIWNLYRLSADGSIDQIGRSGTKHAFLTVNVGCLDSCDHFGNHALGRGCSDTYGTGNNDSPFDMGPRSEIVPAQGIWGRCGSIWDPNCTGSSHSNGNNSWTQRMKIEESKIDPAANPGASYLFESWYIDRDDINIYNSMATVTGTPVWSSGSHEWSYSGQSNYRLGPAIDRWVDPTAPPGNSLNTELDAPEGHAKVAVKAIDLGNGTWRYEYAVMNFDFSRAVIEPPDNGPDPRVVSSQGFDSFSVPVPAGVHVLAPAANVGGINPNQNWRAQIANGHVTWSTDMSIPGYTDSGHPQVTELPTLDWGSMYTFSFIANTPPTAGNGTLHVAETGSPASYDT